MNASNEPPAPEIRTDVLTGRRVIVAASRAKRPNASVGDPSLSATPDPFLEGSESETLGESLAVRAAGTDPDQPGWKVRVVPNLYPAVRFPGDGAEFSSSRTTAERNALSNASFVPDHGDSHRSTEAQELRMGIETSPSDNMLPTCSAFGIHDVVIECPDSRQRLADLNAQEVTWILTAWQTRIRQLTADPRIMHAAIFRNEGFSAGASLAHCHSQIIASTVSPPLIEARTQRSRDHRERTGRDLTADWLESERRDGRRILHDDSCLTVLCPFAPRTSWHVRIVPDASRNGSSVNAAVVPFESIQTADRKSLAVLLSAVVRTLQEHLGPFPFNVVVTMPPFSDPNAFGWMIDVLPRTSRIAGWEYLTDVDIVSTSPEHATAVLRERFQSIVQEELLSRPGSVSEAAVQPADQIVVAENPPSTTMF